MFRIAPAHARRNRFRCALRVETLERRELLVSGPVTGDFVATGNNSSLDTPPPALVDAALVDTTPTQGTSATKQTAPVPLVAAAPPPGNPALSFTGQVARDLSLRFFDLSRDNIVNSHDAGLALLAFNHIRGTGEQLAATDFAVYDTNRSGAINNLDAPGFNSFYLRPLTNTARVFDLLADVRARRTDYNHDGVTNATDAAFAEQSFSYAEGLTITYYPALQAFADRNGDNVVDSRDRALFRTAILGGAADVIDHINLLSTGQVDLNRDGAINLADFRLLVDDYRRLLTGALTYNAAGSVLDHDRNGTLSYDDRDNLIEHLFTQLGLDLAQLAPVTQTDPLGLANGTTVLFVDANNPLAITEARAGRPSTNDGLYWRAVGLNPAAPLKEFRLVNQWGASSTLGKLKWYDRVYINGVHSTTNEMVFQTGGVTFRNYPGRTATLRFGMINQGLPVQVFGYNTTWHGLDFVGNVDTPQGRLYSVNIFTAWSPNTTIEHSTFRAASGLPAGFLNNPPAGIVDVGFGQRRDRNGDLMEPSWQGRGNVVQFKNAPGSIFRDNFLQTRPDFDYQTITSLGLLNHDAVQYLINGEGLLIERTAGMTIERNTIRHFGHGAIAINSSSAVVVRDNDVQNPWNTTIGFYDSHNVTVTGNRLHDWGRVPRVNTAGAYVQSGNGVQITGGQRIAIYRNLFYSAAGYGAGVMIGSNPATPDPIAEENDVYHNTFYNLQMLGVGMGRFAGAYRTLSEPIAVRNNRIYNNVFANVANSAGMIADFKFQSNLFVGGVIGNGNQFFNNVVHAPNLAPLPISVFTYNTPVSYSVTSINSTTFGRSNVQGDPLFRNPAALDFTLLPGSRAIGVARINNDLFNQPLASQGLLTNAGAR